MASSAQQTLDSESMCMYRHTHLSNATSVLHELSQLLGTKLDRQQLAICVTMIESGVNPEALAVHVVSMRR